MRRILLLILLAVALASCATGGPPDIRHDMTDFLSQKGLPTTGLKCSMLGTGVTPGPDAMCLLALSNSDANAIVSAVGLQPKTDSAVSWSPSGPDCWTRLDFHDQTESQWYISPNPDPNLNLPDGRHFTYFRLFYQAEKSAGCISVSYSTN